MLPRQGWYPKEFTFWCILKALWLTEAPLAAGPEHAGASPELSRRCSSAWLHEHRWLREGFPRRLCRWGWGPWDLLGAALKEQADLCTSCVSVLNLCHVSVSIAVCSPHHVSAHVPSWGKKQYSCLLIGAEAC